MNILLVSLTSLCLRIALDDQVTFDLVPLPMHFGPAYLRHAMDPSSTSLERSTSALSKLMHYRRGEMTAEQNRMSPVKVPANLPDLVRATFNKAKANGDVNFYPTQVALLTPPTASTPVRLMSFFPHSALPCARQRP